MKRIMDKLNLPELTIGYGMSMFFTKPLLLKLCTELSFFLRSRDKVEYQQCQAYRRCTHPTPSSPISFQTSIDDTLLHRTETVGKVQPHVKAKIVNPKGEVVPVGTPGEICVSGYLVQKG